MTIIQAIILGVVQGLTEFLPISSTAHLRIIPALLGWADPGAAASAVIQIGTLLAVLIYFRNDVVAMASGFFRGLVSRRPFDDEDSRLAWYLVIGTIPIAVAGLTFQKFIKSTARGLWVIAFALVVLALALLVAERFIAKVQDKRTMSDFRLTDAIAIGFGQALALIPGVSRSGSTIMTGMFRRFNHESAARFSFLLSIPAIGLSGVYELIKERHELAQVGWLPIGVATAVSFVTGWASIWFLLRYLRTHTTGVFIVYRIAAGLAIAALLVAGVIQN